MTTIETIEFDARKHHGTALKDKTGAVYITVAPGPFDVATWLWWWLAPSDKRVWVHLRTGDGQKVRARAIRIATRLVTIGKAIEDEPK